MRTSGCPAVWTRSRSTTTPYPRWRSNPTGCRESSPAGRSEPDSDVAGISSGPGRHNLYQGANLAAARVGHERRSIRQLYGPLDPTVDVYHIDRRDLGAGEQITLVAVPANRVWQRPRGALWQFRVTQHPVVPQVVNATA